MAVLTSPFWVFFSPLLEGSVGFFLVLRYLLIVNSNDLPPPSGAGETEKIVF